MTAAVIAFLVVIAYTAVIFGAAVLCGTNRRTEQRASEEDS